MYNPEKYKNQNLIFIIYLFFLIISTHIYYLFLTEYIRPFTLFLVQIALVLLLAFIARKWFMEMRISFIDHVRESYSDEGLLRKLDSSTKMNLFPVDLINEMIKYHYDQENKHMALMDKLKNNNTLLERNSKITDSIIQITSEILSSGEIDEILQTILDKALEIIPNAQKGSILLYNDGFLEFRASHGYDFEVLKHLKFGVNEIFQYDSEDFYEPCIVNSPERFNKDHLDGQKFQMLREGRGFELKSILSCAIQIDGEFLGIINLDSTEDQDAFSKEDKHLIKHLATQIGIALKNARLIEKILYLSRHDSLTGIFNRCHFEEQLMRIYQQYKASNSVFSLAIVDVNELKMINDTYGHEAGDLLLKRFAKGINEKLANEDIFARYGGDEFTIIMPDKNKAQLEKIIKSIKADFEEAPFIYCGKTITKISFGYGITEFPTEAATLEDIVKIADTRMYKNKKKSKRPIL